MWPTCALALEARQQQTLNAPATMQRFAKVVSQDTLQMAKPAEPTRALALEARQQQKPPAPQTVQRFAMVVIQDTRRSAKPAQPTRAPGGMPAAQLVVSQDTLRMATLGHSLDNLDSNALAKGNMKFLASNPKWNVSWRRYASVTITISTSQA